MAASFFYDLSLNKVFRYNSFEDVQQSILVNY